MAAAFVRLPERLLQRLEGPAVGRDCRRGRPGRRRRGRCGQGAQAGTAEGTRTYGVGGDAHAGDHHRVAVGPDAERADIQRLGILDVDDPLVVEVEGQPAADAPQPQRVPRPMHIPSGRDERLVALALVALARARHGIAVALVEQLAVAEDARPELRLVGIPSGRHEGVAAGGAFDGVEHGQVEVAEAVVPAMPHAGEELDAEVAGEFVLRP